MTILHKGVRQEGNQSLTLTRDADFDTQSSDISAEEIGESGRSFQSLIVSGKQLLLYASLLADDIYNGSKLLVYLLVNGTKSAAASENQQFAYAKTKT